LAHHVGLLLTHHVGLLLTHHLVLLLTHHGGILLTHHVGLLLTHHLVLLLTHHVGLLLTHHVGLLLTHHLVLLLPVELIMNHIVLHLLLWVHLHCAHVGLLDVVVSLPIVLLLLHGLDLSVGICLLNCSGIRNS